MGKEIIKENISELIISIELLFNKKKHTPSLLLIYSTIDILAWLNRQAAHLDVERSDFISWVDSYLLPGSKLICTSLELYSARCGIIHSYSAESELSRDKKVKQIWYAWGKANADKLSNTIRGTRLEKIAVVVQVEVLIDALKSGFSKFLVSLDKDPTNAKLVYERGKKFFSNIPHSFI